VKNENLSAADLLATVSGLPKSDVLGIWAKVKENHAKLRDCTGHRFENKDTGPATFSTRVRCTVCGGEVNLEAYNWYTRGLEHGRKGA
jgi:hypothetical protein